ncbi:MAG: hypothetical protein R2752_09060 [Vicinamibacterales bacterium]
MLAIVIGILVVAAVSTTGDWIWYDLGVTHRMAAGVIHGAVLLGAVGGVLGAAAGRLIAGLPIGAVAGVGGAMVYYLLVPAIGQVAIVAAWAAVWILLAWLDGTWLRRRSRSTVEILSRGVLAAFLGGLAFSLVLGTLWGRAPAGGRNYLLQFAAWTFAWTPGILALTLGRRDDRP